MNFQTLNKLRKFVLIASAVGVISIFLPWAKVYFFNVNGFHGIGILAFLAYGFTVFTSLYGKQDENMDAKMWLLTLAGGVLAFLSTLIFLMQVGGFMAFGIFISLAASGAVAFCTWSFKNPEHSIQAGIDSFKGTSTPK